MISYVVVLENRAFAVTGEDGAFSCRVRRQARAERVAARCAAGARDRLAPGAALAVDLELARADDPAAPAQGRHAVPTAAGLGET
jgi:hypothetical protein